MTPKTITSKKLIGDQKNGITYEHLIQAPSTSKSRTISLVSSVPFLDPTAQINLVSLALKLIIKIKI